jgi:hypothetical protein
VKNNIAEVFILAHHIERVHGGRHEALVLEHQIILTGSAIDSVAVGSDA